MTKKLSLLFFICILSALNINAEVYEGSCGTNVRYSLDTSTGLFSITGTGAMNYYSNYSSVPWYSNRSYIKTVEISNGVTSIGDYAFYQCSGLTSVTIPNSVISIGYHAFYECSGLTSVHITDIAAWCRLSFSDSFSNPLRYAKHLFMDGKEITDLVIPNSVTSIGDYAFQYCLGLTSVIIPNSVTRIGSSAFNNCSKLTSVTIPNSVTYIGNSAFNSCSKLTSVTIPNSVKSIGEGAFYGCSKLTSVTIPNSVKSIGDYAFSGCSGLTKVTLNSNAIASKSYISSSTLGRIFGSQVKEYILGENVTSIGSSAFYNCSGLTSITIPNSVTSIGDEAFYGCSGLTSVTIPNSVKSIGDYAFSGCSGLTSITIPNSVTRIGSSAFDGCSGLTSVHITDIAAWCKISFGNFVSNPLFYAKHLFMDGKEITDLVIPNSVTSIGSNAFYYCTGLTSIEIPNSVTSIGESAFEDCSGLTSVTIPNSVTSIGSSAFYGCSGLTSVTIPNSVTSIGIWAFHSCSGLSSVTIPNSVTSIGYEAFSGCSKLTSVTIPNSVMSIGSGAFSGCSGLTSVKSEILVPFTLGSDAFRYISSNCVLAVPYGTKDAYISNGWTTSVFKGGIKEFWIVVDGIYYYFNSNNKQATITAGENKYSGNVIIPSSVAYNGETYSVTSIGESAFNNCSGLTSVTIPNSIREIGHGAFLGCTGITKVTLNIDTISSANSLFRSQVKEYIIGNDVKTIGDNAFNECTDLTTITIGSSVESIGDYAFASIPKLEKIVCYANNVPTTTRTSFENSYLGYVTLYVPASSLDTYKSTAPWKNAASILPLEDIKEKCATPTIIFENGKLSFSCETEGVKYVYNFSTPSESDKDGKGINTPNKLQVSVYAKKDGFENSDVATKEIDLGTSGIRGDLNGDGVVNMPDAMFIVNKVLKGKFPDE